MATNNFRVEIQGWLSLAVAIVGLYFTATQGADTLGALAGISSGRVPEELAGSLGFIRIFGLLLLLIVFGGMFFIGLAVLLGALFRSMGSACPHHTAFALIAAFISLTATITLALFGHLLWIIGGLGTLVLFVSAGLFGAAPDNDDSMGFAWTILLGAGTAAVMGGGLAVGIIHSTNLPANAKVEAITPHPESPPSPAP